MQTPTTMSTCTAPMVRGQHIFTVAEYTFNKGLGVGQFIRSKTFSVGGFDWAIRYYPDGYNTKHQEYISVLLIMTPNAEVRAMYGFRLLSKAQVSQWYTADAPKVFDSKIVKRSIKGSEKFTQRSILEESPFLESDHLIIDCSVIIVKDPVVVETKTPSTFVLPPSGLSKDFGKLLESKKGADVIFTVQGESFPAHRIVLSARSPVFKAEFCGPWKEKDALCITVEDIEPTVFRALLNFIYTDNLIPMEEYNDPERSQIVHHLVSAADRYSLERLKLLCESCLCKNLDVQTVATTLYLADQHGCSNLKDACLKFIVSPDKMDMVMASENYDRLKRKCPDLFVEVLENVCKFPRN